jgi:hypothetical protein
VLGQAIAQMVRTGRWAQLERLRGAVAPEQLFQSIPGVGPELARRLHEHLDVDTLEALELAAHDGRLEEVPGMGPRRAAMLRASLAGMLARTRPAHRMRTIEPGVDLLLDVDREYRRKPSVVPYRRSHLDASTSQVRLGCRSCIPNAATGISPLCSRTPRAPTSSAAAATGW